MLEHIAHVEEEIPKLFNHILGQPDLIKLYFDAPAAALNRQVAWDTFGDLAYQEIFRYAKGSKDELNSIGVRESIKNSVLQVWPVRYYLAMLEMEGAIAGFILKKGEPPVWAIREAHMDILKSILIPDATS